VQALKIRDGKKLEERLRLLEVVDNEVHSRVSEVWEEDHHA
jgi:hypothetical protein